jgi:diguanylate cyclase (GGDEF)-like protein
MDKESYHVMFVDDDRDFLDSMKIAVFSKLTPEGESELELHFVDTPQEGLAFLSELSEEKVQIALIVSDQQMPKQTGIEFLEKSSQFAPRAVKILLTGYASLESAKYAINNNILDQYISKPIADTDNFIALIKNAIDTFYFRHKKEKADLEIKRYVKELKAANKKIKSMHKAAEKIAYLAQGFKMLHLDDVYDLIMTKLPAIFGAQYASLFFYDNAENTLCMARSNYLEKDYTLTVDPGSNTPMMAAIRENRALIVPATKDAPYEFLNKKCLGTSCIIIPFVIDGEDLTEKILGKFEKIEGVLNLGNIQGEDNEELLAYSAKLIQHIIGSNMFNAHRYQETHKLALIDGLTGLYNKITLSAFLSKECELNERNKNQFCFAIFDLDNFKAVNDNHGHLNGDKVLKKVGEIFRKESRKSDILARFGGEEFAVILAGINRGDAFIYLDRIRQEVSSSRFPDSIRITVSIGFSQYKPANGDSMDKLINRADAALYQAKANGKNRVEEY